MYKTPMALATALGVAALLGLSSTTTQAAEAPQVKTAAAPAKVQNTDVYAWRDANVRAEPNTSSEVLSHVSRGNTYPAICWTFGQNVTLEGITSNKWVLLDRTWPKTNGYVTAIVLSGDSTGGVPNKC